MLFRRFGISSRAQRITLSLIALGIAVAIVVLQETPRAGRNVAPPAGPSVASGDSDPARAAAVAMAVRWLESHEGGEHGGAAIARHVGRSDGDLQARLAAEGLSSASSFYDLETAAAAALRTLRHDPNADSLAQWLADADGGPRLVLRRGFRRPIGRIAYPGGIVRDGETAVVTLVRHREADGAAGYRLIDARVEP